MNGGGREFELRHWRSRPKSITIPPTPLTPPQPPSANGDFSPSAYTSLRDLAGPSSSDWTAGSLSPAGGSGVGGEVQIRNRLLNRAAWAYLQPTPSSTERRRQRRFSLRRALSSCFGFIGSLLWPVQIGKRT